VRTGSGVVEVDFSTEKSGRGAYLCLQKDCWQKGLKGNRLEHALRTKLNIDSRQALIDFGNNLPRGD
jgi:hypothetical protein